MPKGMGYGKGRGKSKGGTPRGGGSKSGTLMGGNSSGVMMKSDMRPDMRSGIHHKNPYPMCQSGGKGPGRS